jgi:hypothetical protein
MRVDFKDSRGARRRTRGVENGRTGDVGEDMMGVNETGGVVEHMRSRCAWRNG